MNKHLEQIIDLSIIDKEIDAFETQIDEANYKLEASLAKKDALVSNMTTLEEEIKDEQVKKQKNDMHIAELSAKLEENAKKSADIKTEREMKSLQLEEEIAKEQVTFANEEIERLDKVIENKNVLITELDAQMKEVDDSLSSVQSEVNEKLTVINGERQSVFGRKEKLISNMNQKSLSFYQKVRRWAKNTTAVEVRKQACMGCYMKINDKTYAEVIKGEDIAMCPHCGRILYIAKEEVSA